MLEQFFRGLQRGHPRKTSDDSMNRVRYAMLVDTPPVKNLENPEYMKILLKGKGCLEELFAEIDSTRYRRLPFRLPAGGFLDKHDHLQGGFEVKPASISSQKRLLELN